MLINLKVSRKIIFLRGATNQYGQSLLNSNGACYTCRVLLLPQIALYLVHILISIFLTCAFANIVKASIYFFFRIISFIQLYGPISNRLIRIF